MFDRILIAQVEQCRIKRKRVEDDDNKQRMITLFDDLKKRIFSQKYCEVF